MAEWPYSEIRRPSVPLSRKRTKVFQKDEARVINRNGGKRGKKQEKLIAQNLRKKEPKNPVVRGIKAEHTQLKSWRKDRR